MSKFQWKMAELKMFILENDLVWLAAVVLAIIPVLMALEYIFIRRPKAYQEEKELWGDMNCKKVEIHSPLDRMLVRATYKSFGWTLEDSDAVQGQKGHKYDYFSRRGWYCTKPLFMIPEWIATLARPIRRAAFFLTLLSVILTMFSDAWKAAPMTALTIYVVSIVVNLIANAFGAHYVSAGVGTDKGATDEEYAQMRRDIRQDKRDTAAAATEERRRSAQARRASVAQGKRELRDAERANRAYQTAARDMINEYNRNVERYYRAQEQVEWYLSQLNYDGVLSSDEKQSRLALAREDMAEAAENIRYIEESDLFLELQQNGMI